MAANLITPAEALEDQKQKIDEQIEHARTMRAEFEEDSIHWMMWDGKIDRLLEEKDNLSLSVPNGWIEGDPEHDPDAMLAIEYAQDYAERRDLYELGMGR